MLSVHCQDDPAESPGDLALWALPLCIAQRIQLFLRGPHAGSVIPACACVALHPQGVLVCTRRTICFRCLPDKHAARLLRLSDVLKQRCTRRVITLLDSLDR